MVCAPDPVRALCDAGGPAFAFVDFEDDRDADDAVRGRDGERFGGERLRVEVARGGRRGPTSNNPTGARGPPKHSDYRVLVTGLPSGTSWQDLKDHMRTAGEVGFAEVTRDGASPSNGGFPTPGFGFSCVKCLGSSADRLLCTCSGTMARALDRHGHR